MGRLKQEDQKFYEKVLLPNSSGCMLWTGAKMGPGYGNLNWKGRFIGAHRVSYLLHVGPIPEGQVVMHSCDVMACVAPDHLSAGTQAENLADMTSKGRRRGWPRKK